MRPGDTRQQQSYTNISLLCELLFQGDFVMGSQWGRSQGFFSAPLFLYPHTVFSHFRFQGKNKKTVSRIPFYTFTISSHSLDNDSLLAGLGHHET